MKRCFAIVLLLSSLAFAKPAPPTITIHATAAAVKGVAVTQLLKDGWRLKSGDDSQVIFVRDRGTGWTMVAALGGSPSGCPPPHTYLTLTFAEVDGNTFLTSYKQNGASIRTNGLGCHEQMNDVYAPKDIREQNDMLGRIKTTAEPQGSPVISETKPETKAPQTDTPK